eukprot:jgi/Tetstr1/443629/TSEL_031627.t2
MQHKAWYWLRNCLPSEVEAFAEAVDATVLAAVERVLGISFDPSTYGTDTNPVVTDFLAKLLHDPDPMAAEVSTLSEDAVARARSRLHLPTRYAAEMREAWGRLQAATAGHLSDADSRVMELEVEAAFGSQKELSAFLDKANNSRRLRNEVCALPVTCRERILFNQLDAASSMWTVAIPTARTVMTPHELREVAAGCLFLPSPCLAPVVGSQIILPSTEHNPVTVDLYGDALMNLPASGDGHWLVQHDAIADAFRDHCVHDLGIVVRREVDDLFQQAVPLGNTVPRDELKDLVPDAELSLPAFNVVTGSYDPRSLKSTLLEFKTMRYGVKYIVVPRATAVDRFERSLLGDIQRGLAARDAAWHNTEPGQKGPLRDVLDMSEYTGMVFGTVSEVVAMAKAARDVGVLSVELLAQQADGEELAEVTDITLRDLGIDSVGKVFIQTPSLEVLSLSHNQLTSVNGFGALRCLQYLNLNFNAVASLAGIEECKQLRELYLSNNAVADLEPLAACRSLQRLSLLNNNVCVLDAAVFALSSLPDLLELDLAGNPMSSSPAYRHRLVRDLPSLATLDGELLGPSEGEVALRFFETNPEYDGPVGPHAQPVIAAVAGRDIGRPATPQVLPPRPSSSGRGKAGTPPDVQLFRSEFLNNHPILLEYVVENAVKARPSSARPGSARPRSREEGFSPAQPMLARSGSSKGGSRRSFVDRIRNMAAEEVFSSDMGDTSTIGGMQSALEEELLGADAPPEQVIRRLLQVCGQLERERDEAEEALKRAHGRSASVLTWGETEAVVRQLEKLQADNRKLSAENKNMYILLEENRELKARLLRAPQDENGCSI